MAKFVALTFRGIMYFLLSWIAGSFIRDLLNPFIEAVSQGAATRYLMRVIIETVVVCVFLYIIMRRGTHRGSIVMITEKKPVPLKEALMPIIISVLLAQILPLVQEIDFRINLEPEFYLYAAGSREAFMSLLPQFVLQSAVYAIFMAWGYAQGYKKFSKDRMEMLSKKMTE